MNQLSETGDAPVEARAVAEKHPKYSESDRNPSMEGEGPEDFPVPNKMDTGPDDGTHIDEAEKQKCFQFLCSDTLSRIEEAMKAGEQLLNEIKTSLDEILVVEGTKLPKRT